ncbi:trimethyllysine dioxygenase protein [Rutstroemia sp. NJR-2017a BBW]|nr:trimethyllysine dioxygenase protein [Rutstroemia sp. NJR-2017a BBW]
MAQYSRDNCPCPRCRRQDTLQRQVDIFSSRSEGHRARSGMYITSAFMMTFAVSNYVQGERITLVFTPGNGYLNIVHGTSTTRKGLDLRILWTADSIKENPPSVQYDEVMANDAGVGRWIRMIREFGFCFVDGVPVCPHKTQELLERISFVRHTHYGGFYDFTSDLTMKDTAYTSEAIGPHTDTTYFTDPVRLQMFHLLSHEDGVGGESLLVDGYKAAEELGSRDREILSYYAISWHASGNDGITITPSQGFPIISSKRAPVQIRWNNADRRTVNPRVFEKWAGSAKAFNNIVNDPKMQYWEQLRPGRALINNDDYRSRYLNTIYPRDEVIRHIL